MSRARPIVDGTCYLVTRRCAQRQFLLRPSDLTAQIFLYVLAVAAQRYDVRVHAYCVMSDHYHLLVTDPLSRLPLFAQYLNALVARATNAALGHREAFWGPPTYSAVELVAREDVVAKTAYTLANPVAAGLVPRGVEWPGLWSDLEQQANTSLSVKRPAVFFRSDGLMPETVELKLVAPAWFSPPEHFRNEVASALVDAEREAHAKMAAEDRTFLGAANVCAQDHTARATSFEPFRRLNPRVAARDSRKRIEALARRKRFAREYREAFAARKSGRTDVLFPPGTYLMRVLYGVSCAVWT